MRKFKEKIQPKDFYHDKIILEIKKEVGDKFQLNPFITKAVNLLVDSMMNRDKGVILIGGTGVGKTTVMRCARKVFNSFAEKEMDMILGHQIKDATKHNREGYIGTGDYTMSYVLLDDVGSEPIKIVEYGSEVNPFIDIVEYRYNMEDRMKVLWVTTNLSMGDISERYGDRVASRLVEGNVIANMGGEDFRLL